MIRYTTRRQIPHLRPEELDRLVETIRQYAGVTLLVEIDAKDRREADGLREEINHELHAWQLPELPPFESRGRRVREESR